jgi:hypothetical protein
MAKRQVSSTTSRKKRPAVRRAAAAKSSPARQRTTSVRVSANDQAAPRPPSDTRLDAAAEAVGRALGRTTAAIAERLPWKGRSDGLDLLEQDHRRLKALLEEGTHTTGDAPRRRLLEALTSELTTHELIEEKILYPALKAHAEAKDIVLEGYQEHHVADLVLEELQQLPPSDERWGAKLKVLKENLEHHIEEEEGEMFKTARSILSREQLEEIGARMQEAKERAE